MANTRIDTGNRFERVVVTPDEKAKAGRESWIVSTDGKRTRVVTSPTSAAVMDSTAEEYAPLLKRLAKR